jgi:hypothetical protein
MSLLNSNQQVMSPSTSIGVTKLTDESKYFSWSYEMEMYLRTKGLWNTVVFNCVEIAELFSRNEQNNLGADATPEQAADRIAERRIQISDETRKQWKKDEGKANGYIAQSVGELFYPIVRDPANATARQLWNAIRDRCQGVNSALRIALEDKYNRAKMEDFENLRQYLDRITGITNQLATMNVHIPEERICSKILSSMRAKYEPVRMTIIMQPIENLTLANLRQQFSLEQGTEKQREPRDEHAHNAETKQRYNQPRSNGRAPKDTFKPGIICHYCNKEGHFQSDCRSKKRDEAYKPRQHRGQQQQPSPKPASNQFRQQHHDRPTPNRQQGRPPLKKEHASVVEVPEEVLNTEIITAGWILDSGCTRHMTPDKSLLHDIRQLEQPIVVKGAMQGEDANNNLEGDIYLKGNKIKIQNVLYVPGIRRSLISVRQLCQSGANVEFKNQVCEVSRKEKKLMKFRINNAKLYELDCEEEAAYAATEATSIVEMHERYGHLSVGGLKKLQDQGAIPNIGIKGDEKLNCIACSKGKGTRAPFGARTETETKKVGDLTHSDVCGPIEPASLAGNRYFVTYTDDASRFTKTYFMKQKSEQIEKYKEYRNYMKTQFGIELKKIRTDSGGEYTSEEFEGYLRKKGTIHEEKPARTPQWRGVSERLNRTLFDKARAMLKGNNVPNYLWAEAIKYATDLKNASPTKLIKNATPHERFTGEKANYENFRTFGSQVEFKDNNVKKKLDDRTTTGIYIGYDSVQKCSRIFIPATMRIAFARNNEVSFHGKELTTPEQDNLNEPRISSGDAHEREVIYLDDEDDEEEEPIRREQPIADGNQQEQPNVEPIQVEQPVFEQAQPREPARIERARNQQLSAAGRPVRVTQKRQQREFDRLVSSKINSLNVEEALMTGEEFENTPTTYQEVLANENKENWIISMKKEVESLYDNHTFEIVGQPEGKPIVSSKWVLKLKRKPDGSVDKFKARLVARGFSQTQGVDFTETFAPTLRMETIRFLINYALKNNLETHHMDVNAAFLNGELSEEIYMKLPDGFAQLHEDPKFFQGKVAKLNRALYGLKQSMRCWNIRLTNYLKESGYTQSQADPSLFILYQGEKVKSIIATYVDDCLIIGNQLEVAQAKQVLIKEFKMTDLGKLTGMLGINFTITKEKAILDQTFYTVKLLERFQMNNARPIATPIVPEPKEEADESPCDQKLFRQAIGGLLYLSKCTRPDITYAVNQVARKMENPTEGDWKNVKRIFRYLSGTKDLGLTYTKDDEKIVGYSDASYASMPDRKSTSGYLFIMNNGAITWRSKRQPVVATSSMEAEYIALASAAKEALWIRKIAMELHQQEEKMVIMEDNQACIKFARDAIHNDRTKHIDVRYFFVRDRVEKNQLQLLYCPTTEMLADMLTKPLGAILFNRFSTNIGMQRSQKGSLPVVREREDVGK